MSNTAWWVDILERRLLELRLDNRSEALVHELPVMPSAVVPVGADSQLLVAEDGLHLRSLRDGRLDLFCPVEAEIEGNRSNDAAVHQSGALWLGTMARDAEAGRGTIYHVAGTTVTPLFENVSIPNGLSFSPDGATGYFVDSAEGVLRRVALDPSTGLPVDSPEDHYDHRGGQGDIDGAVVDHEGLIWAARFGSGCIDAYSPDGRRVRSVAVPIRQPTKPTFAGRHLDKLLVTSAYEGMGEAARAADPDHGRTVLIDVGARGTPAPSFRLLA